MLETKYKLSLNIPSDSRSMYDNTGIKNKIPLSIRNEQNETIEGGELNLNVDSPEEITVLYTNTGEEFPIEFPHLKTTMHGNSVQKHYIQIKVNNINWIETFKQELRFYLETKNGETIDEQIVTLDM